MSIKDNILWTYTLHLTESTAFMIACVITCDMETDIFFIENIHNWIRAAGRPAPNYEVN